MSHRRHKAASKARLDHHRRGHDTDEAIEKSAREHNLPATKLIAAQRR